MAPSSRHWSPKSLPIYVDGNVNLVQMDQNEISINQLRFQDKTNGKFYRNGRKGRTENGGRNSFFCPGCFAVGKELKVAIDFKHKPSMCPRVHAVSRFMQAELSSENEPALNGTEQVESDGNKILECNNQTIKELFQNDSSTHTRANSIESQALITDSSKHIFMCDNMNNHPNCPNNGSQDYDISDCNEIMHLKVQKLQGREYLWSQNTVRKETSPMVEALLRYR